MRAVPEKHIINFFGLNKDFLFYYQVDIELTNSVLLCSALRAFRWFLNIISARSLCKMSAGILPSDPSKNSLSCHETSSGSWTKMDL